MGYGGRLFRHNNHSPLVSLGGYSVSPILLFLLSRIPMLLLAPLRGDFFTSLEADFALR